jgi:long-chain fatty acid transport protein
MKTDICFLSGGRSRLGLATGSILIGVSLSLPTNSGALGLRIPNQDAEAIARGNAFAATADDPAAIYYNPAGITQLDGWNAEFGVHALSLNSVYETPSGSTYSSDFSIQPVPEFYVTDTLKDKPFSFGLGMYAPFGMAMDWPDEVSFHNSAPYHGMLNFITVNPVMAWKISDQLSIAAGPTYNYAQLVLEQGLSPLVPGSTFQYSGHGGSFGYTAGIRWQPADAWSFGAKYESGTIINFNGTASATGVGTTYSSVEIPFPQFAAGGVSFRPTTKWNVEADVDWTYWHRLQTVTFESTPLGTIHDAFGWKSTFMFEVGATRYLDDGYYCSFGYFYSPNSTSDQNFTPVDPDTDLHVGSVGFGHKGPKWDWVLASQLITGPDRTVSNAANPTVDGQYRWLNGSLDASIAYHF